MNLPKGIWYMENRDYGIWKLFVFKIDIRVGGRRFFEVCI